jgi:dihydroorotase
MPTVTPFDVARGFDGAPIFYNQLSSHNYFSMTILIRKALVIDPDSPYHNSHQDILIQNGIITEVSGKIDTPADRTIDIAGLHLSPGWVDIFTHCGDPGYEFKETLETGARAAASGGFTHIFVIPNTQPAIQNKSTVEYVSEKQVASPVRLHPIGAVTRQIEGKELAEMYDMRNSGAVAFSDGLKPVQSAGLLIKAMQYVKAFNGVIIQIPDDASIAPNGLMHEGITSTRMGLPGKPALAEELMVARDIKLTRYAGSRLHITGISARKSLEYIRRAKDAGIDITCSVTPHHLYFTEEDLGGYDTNLKVSPPIRTTDDRDALRKALLDGTVDCITSHHQPHEWDSKICEFEYAKYGISGLETVYGVLGSLDIRADRIEMLLSRNPRKIFNLPAATVTKGSEADLTLFLPAQTYPFDSAQMVSKSRNTPFGGKTLTGRVAGVIHGNRSQLHY